MNIRILRISKSPKPQILASIRFELSSESGDTIIVDDARVLKNRLEQTWLAMPSYSIQEGKSYRYEPAITLSSELRRHVESLALAAYERWQTEQDGTASGSGETRR